MNVEKVWRNHELVEEKADGIKMRKLLYKNTIEREKEKNALERDPDSRKYANAEMALIILSSLMTLIATENISSV